MSDYRADVGVFSAVLHFLLGAIFGGVIFCFITWFFFAPNVIMTLAAAGALIMGILAAIWRNRFWTALANNPLFQAWRALNGGR